MSWLNARIHEICPVISVDEVVGGREVRGRVKRTKYLSTFWFEVSRTQIFNINKNDASSETILFHCEWFDQHLLISSFVSFLFEHSDPQSLFVLSPLDYTWLSHMNDMSYSLPIRRSFGTDEQKPNHQVICSWGVTERGKEGWDWNGDRKRLNLELNLDFALSTLSFSTSRVTLPSLFRTSILWLLSHSPAPLASTS